MATKFTYGNAVLNSFSIIKNNLKLFVPDLIAIALSGILIGLILGQAALFVLTSGSDAEIEQLISENIQKIAGFAFVLGLVFLFFLVVVILLKCMKLLMIRDIVYKKKALTLWNYFLESRKFFWRFIGIIFLVGLILLLLLLFFIIGIAIKNIPLIVFGILIAIILGILLFLGFFFVSPTLFVNNKGVIDTLKLSWNYYTKNKLHTFLTLLLIIGVSIIGEILIKVISFIPFVFGVLIINLILGLILGLWTAVFIFLAYKH